MSRKIIFNVLVLFIVFFILGLCSGCQTQSPVIIDSGDIERLRAEYNELRAEYDKLQSDYSRLVTESQFYAEYYKHTTEAIADGIRELSELGSDSLTEIAKLRSYITILRNIIDSINSGQSAEGQPDITTNAE